MSRASEGTMNKQALTPLAKDAYSYGAEQAFSSAISLPGKWWPPPRGNTTAAPGNISGTSSGGALTRWRGDTWPKRWGSSRHGKRES